MLLLERAIGALESLICRAKLDGNERACSVLMAAEDVILSVLVEHYAETAGHRGESAVVVPLVANDGVTPTETEA